MLMTEIFDKRIHSNFIYSMINPKYTHYCGNVFLNFFLEVMIAVKSPDTKNHSH